MKKSGLADSPFFTAPTPPIEVRKVAQPIVYEAPERKSERTEERTEIRSEKRTVAPLPVKRRTKRYSFEFYEDQLIKLKRLKFQAEMAGERINLSDFVREALDQYLQDKEVE